MGNRVTRVKARRQDLAGKAGLAEPAVTQDDQANQGRLASAERAGPVVIQVRAEPQPGQAKVEVLERLEKVAIAERLHGLEPVASLVIAVRQA